MVRFAMSSKVSVTRRNRSVRWPTRPASTEISAVRAYGLHPHRLAEQRSAQHLSLTDRGISTQLSLASSRLSSHFLISSSNGSCLSSSIPSPSMAPEPVVSSRDRGRVPP